MAAVALLAASCGVDEADPSVDAPLVDAEGLMVLAAFSPPLHTQGRFVVDAAGRRVKLMGTNWHGANDRAFVPGGLDVAHRDTLARTLRAAGYNLVRLPYSDELVRDNPRVALAQGLQANPDLAGLPALDVLEAVVAALNRQGIGIMLNDHSTRAEWCCGINPCELRWHNALVPGCKVRQTETDWISHWLTLVTRMSKYSMFVAVDLRNEVRDPTVSWERWARAAERAGNAIHTINPRLLVVVEGINSGQDLTGAALRPVDLHHKHKVVYSPHVYAWFWFGGRGAMYGQMSYERFAATMDQAWGFLLEGRVTPAAPVWLGEFGAAAVPGPREANYFHNLVRYAQERDLGFGYWPLNPHKAKGHTLDPFTLMRPDWRGFVTDWRTAGLRALGLGARGPRRGA